MPGRNFCYSTRGRHKNLRHRTDSGHFGNTGNDSTQGDATEPLAQRGDDPRGDVLRQPLRPDGTLLAAELLAEHAGRTVLLGHFGENLVAQRQGHLHPGKVSTSSGSSSPAVKAKCWRPPCWIGRPPAQSCSRIFITAVWTSKRTATASSSPARRAGASSPGAADQAAGTQ